MTSVWGPLGWMTLHSAAHNYPENPSSAERQLVSQWLDLFQETITCPSCRSHFTELLAQYRTSYPDFLSSKRGFILFSYRAHNTVNRRLDKPVYPTSEACHEVYVRNIAARSGQDYRLSYLNHIMRNWRSMFDISGVIGVRKVQEMMRIEAEYWSLRNTEPTLIEGEVVSPLQLHGSRGVRGMDNGPVLLLRPPRGGGVSFRGGRLQFRR